MPSSTLVPLPAYATQRSVWCSRSSPHGIGETTGGGLLHRQERLIRAGSLREAAEGDGLAVADSVVLDTPRPTAPWPALHDRVEAVRALIARKAASSPPLLHDLDPDLGVPFVPAGARAGRRLACPRLAIPPPGEELELSGKFREQ